MKYLSEEDEQFVAEEMQGSPASKPPVRSSALLAELEATQDKLDELLEAARGPGRHLVFMAIKDARYHFQDAVYAEKSRLSANDRPKLRHEQPER